jgi:hypothetical protein
MPFKDIIQRNYSELGMPDDIIAIVKIDNGCLKARDWEAPHRCLSCIR